jgi:hypothetical protein
VLSLAASARDIASFLAAMARSSGELAASCQKRSKSIVPAVSFTVNPGIFAIQVVQFHVRKFKTL